MVRLKAIMLSSKRGGYQVSIPYGSIKSDAKNFLKQYELD